MDRIGLGRGTRKGRANGVMRPDFTVQPGGEGTVPRQRSTKRDSTAIHAGKRGEYSLREHPASIGPADVVVFLIPCLQFVRITVIGVLNGSDMALLAVFLYLAVRGRLRIATAVGKWTLILCSFWLASQCVTDIVRHSAFADYARGWSNIGLTFVTLAVLWTLLYGRTQRLVFFGWGLVVGNVLLFLINPPKALVGASEEFAWKFVYAYSVSLGLFLIASRKEFRGLWPITLAVVIGAINILLGSRSMGGVCLAAALYLLVTHVSRGEGAGRSKLKAGTAVALAASILLSVAGVLWGYGRAASSGILGADAEQKYERESSGKYGVLLGGRTELLASLPAIYDSPILGHGSWAKDPSYIIGQHRALLLLGYRAVGKLVTLDELRYGLIPAHSYLFQAWVDAGILGAVFWGWILLLTARVIMRVNPTTTELLPGVSFLAFLLLWTIPFSPYGTDGRLTFPYTLVMLMTFTDMAFHKAARAPANNAKRKIKTALIPRPQH